MRFNVQAQKNISFPPPASSIYKTWLPNYSQFGQKLFPNITSVDITRFTAQIDLILSLQLLLLFKIKKEINSDAQ